MSLFLKINFQVYPQVGLKAKDKKTGVVMTKLLFIVISSLLYCQNCFSLDISATLWEKDICSSEQVCLPKAIGKPLSFIMAEPANNSFSRLKSNFGEYTATFTFTKRTDGSGYYSFQVELNHSQDGVIALCSRYEGLDTLENAMVGACAGKKPNKNKLVGISLHLPQ